jgi:hypothetical protein
VARTKKPKIQIKREQTSLGWAYRIYIDGMLMGAMLSLDAAYKSVPRMLAIYEKINSRPMGRLKKESRT